MSVRFFSVNFLDDLLGRRSPFFFQYTRPLRSNLTPFPPPRLSGFFFSRDPSDRPCFLVAAQSGQSRPFSRALLLIEFFFLSGRECIFFSDQSSWAVFSVFFPGGLFSFGPLSIFYILPFLLCFPTVLFPVLF